MKRFFIIVGALILVTLGHYIYRQWPRPKALEVEVEKAGITWPTGTRFEIDEEDNPVFILNGEMTFMEGSWPEGSRVYFKEDKIAGVEVFEAFEFAQFEFLQPAKIAVGEEGDQPFHVIELTEKLELDGLPLSEGCLIKFKNYTLEKASCPEYENVYFKRKIQLPEAKN